MTTATDLTTTFEDETGRLIQTWEVGSGREKRIEHKVIDKRCTTCGVWSGEPCQGAVECLDWGRPRDPEVQAQIDEEDSSE